MFSGIIAFKSLLSLRPVAVIMHFNLSLPKRLLEVFPAFVAVGHNRSNSIVTPEH